MSSEQETIDQPVSDSGLFSGQTPIREALNELRLRLLDLTGRNRLINFKHAPGKSLQFSQSAIDATFSRLIADQSSLVTVAALPEPDRQLWDVRGGRSVRPDPVKFASELGIDPSFDLKRSRGRTPRASGSRVQTLLFAEDLGKHGRKLEREAKSAIDETGANMLYLVLGFLDFPEQPDSEKIYRAPLICVPVKLSHTDESRYSTFSISHSGEELANNLSLREKLKRDFAFNLPEFDNESQASVEVYLDEVEAAIEEFPGWSVKRMMTLTLLSFSNMLLVRELDPEEWPSIDDESSLLQNPLVKQVFEGRPAGGEAQYAEEFAIDEHPGGNLPLIFDADSSQHSALIDVHDGKSRVIEGPPGTGKSQTITNLIASALATGKTVLFVAEKLAALEVVKARLTSAGLAPFVLELHSNKTSKKRVLEDLEARIKVRIPGGRDLPELLERQEKKRQALKVYAELMNLMVPHLELTLQQVMWRAELNRLRSGESALAVQHLTVPSAISTSAARHAELRDLLRHLGGQLEAVGEYGLAHPLWGFFPAEFKPEDDLPVRRTLREFAPKFAAFEKATREAAELLGGLSLSMSADSAHKLIEAIGRLAPADSAEVAFDLLPKMFTASDPDGACARRVLDDLETKASQAHALEAKVLEHLVCHPVAADIANQASRLTKDMADLGFGPLPAAGLINVHQQLTRATATASAALTRLHAIAATVDLPFEWSMESVGRLRAVATAVASAPHEVLHLRHAGLRGPRVVDVIETGLQKLQSNQRLRQQLDARLYLDALPDSADLEASILTLREGAAWYRIFQKDWRSAIRMHKRLQKGKTPLPPNERQRDLEQLRLWVSNERAWREDSALRAASGEHFNAEQTPLNDLLANAKWIRQADDLLDAVNLSLSTFDAVQVDRSALRGLRGRLEAVEEAQSILASVETTCAAALSRASPDSRVELFNADWKRRLAATDAAAASAAAIHLVHNEAAKPEVSTDDCFRHIALSRAVTVMDARLAQHEDALDLLGERYTGRTSDLEPAVAAYTYGSMVRKSGLPLAIERVLVAPECVLNHDRLMSHVEAIDKGWDAVGQFTSIMKAFGRFDLEAWTNSIGSPTSEFARQVAAKTALASDRVDELMPWAQYVGTRSEAVEAGLEDFVVALESRAVSRRHIEYAFSYRAYATVVSSAFEKHRALRTFVGARHSSIRQEFAELDKSIIEQRGNEVARLCRSNWVPPVGTDGIRVDEKTEMSLINYLVPQQRPRVPVRKMLRRAGNAIQALKPCFMMGPQAVAQFLEPGLLKFDIVVMDEASQLRPEQAIGAIARGSQLVVVGDPKQLPPTSFFSRTAPADGDDDDGQGAMVTTDAESILDVCISHFQPVRTLRWHYRSRHESLIAFSNHNFYRGNLVVFPSPYPKSKSLGLRYHYIRDGIYESQMNQVEGARIVDAVVEHILLRPADSVGVVTLNVKQRDLVSEMLEERIRHLEEAVAFKERWDSEGMGLFIKNLENVQGDERDCILISTTFGKAPGSNVVRQNFGPISREGGWRRLNVLFTRARKSVVIFSSMRPEDIVVDAKTPEGTKALRAYLEYARDGVLSSTQSTGLPPDSDFEVAVMDVLRARGYELEPQLGVAGFRIDIAVRHPTHRDGFLAAIECDGASYHSGVSVRDRDRIRQEILESLGWRGRIWRIWSTDWFRNPLAETERLVQFLNGLKEQPVPDEYVVDEMSVDEVPVDEEPVDEEPATSLGSAANDASKSLPLDLVFPDEADEIEIEVGDLVTYAATGALDTPLQVRLSSRVTSPEQGLIAQNTPLGAILIGATVGETVVLRVPSRAPQSFLIQAIKRQDDEAA